MNKTKKYLIGLIILLIMPMFVKAGSINFNKPIKTSDNTYQFTLTVNDITLNSISGNFIITNGTITKITMSSSWTNKTGISSNFYFYHNGPIKGDYKVATIEVAMTGNSEYTVNNLKYNLNKCVIDNYGNHFGENGIIVSKSTYESTCLVNKDDTLKSITPSSGTLYPAFVPSSELYSLTVDNSVSTINFNPVVNNIKAKVISGSTCNLKVGLNICKIVVQAEAGNTKTYKITVSRKNSSNNTLSDDASIRNLEVHGGTLTKTFNPNIKEYDVKVNGGINQIYFTFITNSNNQKNTSGICNINESTKSCKLTITAQDKVTKNSYVFNIIHENSDNQNSSNNNNNNNNNNNSNTTNKPSNSVSNNSNSNSNNSNNNSSSNNNVGNNSNISNDGSIDVDVNNKPNNDNNNSNNNTDKNDNDKVDNSGKEEQQSDNEEVKEVINIPIINKEIKKTTFIKLIAVIDLLLGIIIGVLIAKILRRIAIIRGK